MLQEFGKRHDDFGSVSHRQTSVTCGIEWFVGDDNGIFGRGRDDLGRVVALALRFSTNHSTKNVLSFVRRFGTFNGPSSSRKGKEKI